MLFNFLLALTISTTAPLVDSMNDKVVYIRCEQTKIHKEVK